MDIDDIKDRESLEAWLKTRPREDAVAIAHRAALRVFPLFGRAMGEDLARKYEFSCLLIFRCKVTATVAQEFPSIEIKENARAAALDADFAKGVAIRSAPAVAVARAAAALARSVDAMGSTADAVRFAISAAPKEAVSALWEAIRADVVLLFGGSDPVLSPLWPETPPDWFNQADRETRAIWAENPAHWEFWTRWWDAAIAGRPLDWDLQRDVALIPDEVWQQGPGPVAVEIARLEELHGLRRELAELKRRLTDPPPAVSVAAGAELRGHNNPPELLDATAELRQNIVVVWQALDEAETELAKRHPEPAALKRIGMALLTATKAIALYCATLGDTAVKNAAAEFGKAGGKWLAGGAAFGIALNIPPIARFAERLLDFIK